MLTVLRPQAREASIGRWHGPRDHLRALLGHSSVATTAAIYAHAIRGKDRAAAQVWDDLMQQARAEVSKDVN